jgi:hypothetical protein
MSNVVVVVFVFVCTKKYSCYVMLCYVMLCYVMLCYVIVIKAGSTIGVHVRKVPDS